MSNPNKDYQKIFFWVNQEDIERKLEEIKKTLKIDRIPTARERQCEALSPNIKIMHIPPEVWSKSCYRQGSWYRSSTYSKKHLIVSNFDLSFLISVKAGVIKKIKIDTYPNLPKEKWMQLLETDSFINRAPSEWFQLLDREIPVFNNFIDRNRMNVSIEELLKMHSANHANFLLSRGETFLTCLYDGENIPSSLFPQEFTCSACLELFGVLGNQLQKKIIKKCPGLKYVTMNENEYFFALLK